MLIIFYCVELVFISKCSLTETKMTVLALLLYSITFHIFFEYKIVELNMGGDIIVGFD